jgi:hypothetical protein
VPAVSESTPGLTPCERERLYQLCARIVDEQDCLEFMQLAQKLSDLLDRKKQRLDERPRTLRLPRMIF